MNTKSDTLPEEAPEVEPDEMIDPDIDIPGPFQNQHARMLAEAVENGIPFCQRCGAAEGARTMPQGG